MKKLTVSLLFALGLVTVRAEAAGPYDGIWIVTYFGVPIGYYTAHERDGTLVAVSLEGDNSSWEAFIGQRAGNTISLATIVGGLTTQVNVTFTSLSTLTATQVSCVPRLPGWTCEFPNGAAFQGTKVW